jgi:spermidine/putrescine ABC transporter ATP-binding subunit
MTQVASATGIDVSLQRVRKSFGPVTAIKELTLDIPRGAFFSLLGPSGCGKTTALRILAGFEQPDLGEVFIRGKRVTNVPPYRRDYGMVFQNFALFPHLSIKDNVAFGLRIRGVERGAINSKVNDVLAVVKLSGFGDRFPDQLSGGQQQRVALARVLVLKPAVLLLDESLGSLDRKLREEMQIELRELQRQFEITTVFVTHDQDEALAMSDTIAIMNDGVIEQLGTPRAVYEQPRTEFVARFMGASNILAGTIAAVDGASQRINLEHGQVLARRTDKRVGQRLSIAVRPENISLSSEAGDFGLRATVTSIVYHGAVTQVHLEAGCARLVANVNQSVAGQSWSRGDIVYCRWGEDSTIVLVDPH